MTTMTDTPKVWIACLASYNAGRLIGEWVNATDVDEMNEGQKRVAEAAWKEAVKCGDAPVYFGYPEEFAIHDYDGFGSVSSTLGEYPSYETVANIGQLIEEYGEAFLMFLDASEVDLDTVTESDFMESYRNVHDSEEDYAMEYVGSCGWSGVPAEIEFRDRMYRERTIKVFEELESCIDWEKVAQELFDFGNLSSRPCSTGGVHVFEDVG